MRLLSLLLLFSLADCTSEPNVSPARAQRAIEHVRRDLARSRSALKPQPRSDGITALRVESGFRHATIVTRAADGTKRARCVNQADEAERMLTEGGE